MMNRDHEAPRLIVSFEQNLFLDELILVRFTLSNFISILI